MARQNYSFERRQRDLARKKKAEEKLARKLAKSKSRPNAIPPGTPEPPAPVPESRTPTD